MREIEIKRFKGKISLPDQNGCMNWLAAKHLKGYGAFTNRSFNTRIAHRIAWILEHGEIPKGLLVCHSCDNPACVNVKHLWLGTAKDNSQDMVKKNRGNLKKGIRFKHAPFRPNSKLTEDQVTEIRKRIKKGETMVSLGKEFNISDRTINEINSGYIWGLIESKEERDERIEIVKSFKSERTRLRMRKLTDSQIKEIKVRLSNGESRKQMQIDYNVSEFCIYNIIHGGSWKDI